MDRRDMGSIFCPIKYDPRTKQQIQNVQNKKKEEFQVCEDKKNKYRNSSIGNNKKFQDNSINPLSTKKIKDDYYVSSSAYGSYFKNNINIINNTNNTRNINNNNDRGVTNKAKEKGYELCGIKNIGNNCYLNSGLQILARCPSFADKLIPFNSNKYPFCMLLNQAFNSLLNKREYDPSFFVKYFCEKNIDFMIGEQNCSQNFIRTVLTNVNDEIKLSKTNCIYSFQNYSPKNEQEKKDYKTYIKENKIYPESEALFMFTGILKSYSYGKCESCFKEFNKNTFCYFIDQNMYLNNIYQKCTFKDVIDKNLPPSNIIGMECLYCKNMIKIEEETKIVKLPEILVFTLERFLGGPNKVEIIPDEILDLQKYIDPNLNGIDTIYELFAKNIRFGSTKNWGHEICQIKIDGYWYEFNDTSISLKKRDYNDCSYGLYYRRVSN